MHVTDRTAAMTFTVDPPLYRYEHIAPVTDHGGGHRSGPRLRIGDHRRADRPGLPGRRRCVHRRRIGGARPLGTRGCDESPAGRASTSAGAAYGTPIITD